MLFIQKMVKIIYMQKCYWLWSDSTGTLYQSSSIQIEYRRMQKKEIRSGIIKCTVLAPNSKNKLQKSINIYITYLHIKSRYIQYVQG